MVVIYLKIKTLKGFIVNDQMSTYTQILYQIVFGTYKHEKGLDASNRPELFKYITGILQNKKCHLYRIGGISNHIHIVIHLHPSVALAALIKDVKLATTDYIKKKKLFPTFSGWQNGYGAFTYSFREKYVLIEYVKNQESHHQKKTYKQELIELLTEHEIDYNENYLL